MRLLPSAPYRSSALAAAAAAAVPVAPNQRIRRTLLAGVPRVCVSRALRFAEDSGALHHPVRAYHYVERDVIDPSDVSFLPSEDQADASSTHDTKAVHGGVPHGEAAEALASACSSQVPTSEFEEVRELDPFSRARVVNFIKRYSQGSVVEHGKGIFVLHHLGEPEDALYHCCVPLPLPRPGGEEDSNNNKGLWAHGVACDGKEAELLAAMHAERIIDALGYHIYTLPSMQRKHALAARKAGRSAPLPTEAGTASSPSGASHALSNSFPKPLRRVSVRDETEKGKWQLIDLRRGNSSFQSASPATTLLSPCVLDAGAQSRVQLFLRAKGFYFAHVLNVETEKPAERGLEPFFIATITFPRGILGDSAGCSGDDDEEASVVVAQGKARVKETAISLACMHAELTLDALDIPLFPQDDAKQKEHAMTAWGYGRPAPLCGASPKDAARVSLPLPIKELVVPVKGGKRFSLPSGEEDLVQRHRAVAEQISEFMESAVAESTAVADLQAFLHTMKQPRASNPFFREAIQGVVKSTVVLPVSDAFGIRGGVGIANRGADADVLAAMHALDVLTALGIPVKPEAAAQSRWALERADKFHGGRAVAPIGPADQSPPGWRLASGIKTFTSAVSVMGDEPPRHPQTGSGSPGDAPLTTSASQTPAQGTARKPRRVAKRAKAAAADPDTTNHFSDTQTPASTVGIAGQKGGPSPLDDTHLAAARERVPREWWDLEADSPDGYIMVAPHSSSQSSTGSDRGGVYFEAALRSPRQLDPLVRPRITQYLASLGRRFEDVFFTQFLDVDENGGQGIHRCVAKVPLPHRFGDRVAIGEAATAPEAEQLAAMHAELLLDALGVCLFADAKRQKQHADACEQWGRWAPSALGQERPVDTRSPPPLRREYVGSLHWERLQEKKKPRIVSVPRSSQQQHGKVEETAVGDPPASPPTSPTASSGPQAKQQDGPGTVLAAGSSLDPLLPSMEVDDAANYTTVAESELDLVAKARVQYYLRRRGVKSVDAEYTVVMGRGTVLHEATWELPLPSSVRTGTGEEGCSVKGVAATKRDAEILSWMHAERVLDALGVPIFDNLPKLQQWHAEQAAKQGRSAPPLLSPTASDGDSAKTGTPAVLPPLPPLRLAITTTGSDGLSLVKPEPPDVGGGGLDAADAWAAYVDQCTAYIQESKLAVHNSYFALDRVPRSGEPLFDHTLDTVESEPVQADSKMLMNNYCLASGTQYPAYWKSQTVGPLTHRVSWAVIPVPGFEYVSAQGVGANKEVAQRRAAMHALALLSHIDPDYPSHLAKATSMLMAGSVEATTTTTTKDTAVTDSEEEFDLETFSVSLIEPAEGDTATGIGPGSPVVATKRKQKLPPPAYDAASGTFTAEGKVRLLELLSLCMGVAPPVTRQMVRLTQESASEPRRVHLSTTVSFVDEDGKLWEGTSATPGRRRSEQLAYEQLYEKLDKDMAVFARVKELLIRDPYLNPRVVPNVVLSPSLKDRIHAIVGDEAVAVSAQHGQGRNSGATADEEDEVAVDLNQLAESKRAAAMGEGEGDSAHTLSRLLSIAAMNEAQVAQESQYLLEKHQEKITSPGYLDHYAKARERLSITARKEEIVRGIEKYPVLIICGTTGCGKTTQVPQFILDHLTNQGRGGECSILITQPRRLSAVSIAQRVAAERLERIGDSTGYSIRFDSRPGKHINFCTSGILLRMLHSSPTLEGINYLIIDEIHERDINSDFLLVLLKELLVKRTDLRVVLMSATLQAEQFGLYFDNAPIINVEGYVYPVQELFLEDLVPHAEEHNFLTPLLKEAASYREKAHSGKSNGSDFDRDGLGERDDDGRGSGGRRTYGVLEATTEIDYPTIQFAIEQAMRMVDLSASSVLVFLPGWEEITRAKEILERHAKYHIIPLHSSVGQEEQMACFLPASEGKVKVILSTNIAESGVTIDDVGAVIDVGRAKEKSFLSTRGTTNVGSDHFGSVSQLLTVYASRANCVQRRGRVGRTRPGICIRLYSKAHFDSLHDFQTPEMLRTPLDALCLQILSLNLGDPAVFLERALEPPTRTHVESALQRLHDLGATTSKRQLTPLGLRLSMLPVEPKMGKVILLGALLRCLDSALTIASVVQTDVFVSARGSREAVRLHKEDMSRGTQSDPIASVNGFNFWVTAHHQKPPAEVVTALQDRLLSVPHLIMVSRHKKQFHDILRSSGFLAHGGRTNDDDDDDSHASPPQTASWTPYEIFVDKSVLSQDALDVGLVKCVVAAGLFPNVAIIQGKRSLRTKLQNHVTTSSDSVLHRTAPGRIQQPYFVFSEITKSSESSRLSARELTNVSLWTLLLMGTGSMPLTYDQDLSLAFVDEWIPFRITFGTMDMLRKLKRALQVVLGRAYTNPTDGSNNARLEEIRLVLKELVNTPVKPNALGGGDTVWVEAGSIVQPDTEKRPAPTRGESGGELLQSSHVIPASGVDSTQGLLHQA